MTTSMWAVSVIRTDSENILSSVEKYNISGVVVLV